MGTIRESWLDLPSGRVRLLASGDDGPPVLLLHGGGTDSARMSWEPTLHTLAPRFRAFAPDWPGYGASPLPARPVTQELLLSLARDLMDRLELPRVTLAGISMGGGAALGSCLAQPERVERLVLVDSYGLAPRAPMHPLSWLVARTPGLVEANQRLLRRSPGLLRFGMRALVGDPDSLDPELVAAVTESVSRPYAGRAFVDWQRTELRWNGFRTCYRDRLAEIACPTLIVHGDRDRLIPVAAAREAAAAIPDAELHVFPRCGHWAQRERPDAFREALLAFLG